MKDAFSMANGRLMLFWQRSDGLFSGVISWGVALASLALSPPV
jgi:uncharacterized membrane protein YidH (DUF202 family)